MVAAQLKTTTTMHDKISGKEQVFQSILFEIILLLITVPAVIWLGESSVPMPAHKATVIAVTGSLMALVINYIYNLAFDQLFGHSRVERGKRLRILHALGFEACLLLGFLPFLMWYAGLTFWQALVMDIALMGMTVVYTFIFHWVYDHARHRLRQGRH